MSVFHVFLNCTKGTNSRNVSLVETSQPICKASHLTGFYVRKKLA